MMAFEELERKVLAWGREKGILSSPNPQAQFLKTKEEVAELGVAIEERDIEEIEDAIGDITVTLLMQCEAWNIDFTSCLAIAYNTISKRTGKMVDGQFVKDSK